jgi:prepilin-type N-terminal cleavage/methylation domain-containing protein
MSSALPHLPPAPGGRRQPQPAAGGFTLIELLVVMAILAVLGGLSVAGLSLALRRGQERDEEVSLTMLVGSIKTYENEMRDYPPTTLDELKISGNNVNQGNESLFAHLQTRKRGGPFIDDLPQDRWQNYDADVLLPAQLNLLVQKLNWARAGNQLLEYTDRWGNPYVYIHSRDYGRTFHYMDAEGNVFQVEAARDTMTGGYAAPSSFQLWSIGHDCVNQNGGGDDICSWK